MPITYSHELLARLWCQWNGQQGTASQAAKIMARTSAETLERMLAARGLYASGPYWARGEARRMLAAARS